MRNQRPALVAAALVCAMSLSASDQVHASTDGAQGCTELALSAPNTALATDLVRARAALDAGCHAQALALLEAARGRSRQEGYADQHPDVLSAESLLGEAHFQLMALEAAAGHFRAAALGWRSLQTTNPRATTEYVSNGLNLAQTLLILKSNGAATEAETRQILADLRATLEPIAAGGNQASASAARESLAIVAVLEQQLQALLAPELSQQSPLEAARLAYDTSFRSAPDSIATLNALNTLAIRTGPGDNPIEVLTLLRSGQTWLSSPFPAADPARTAALASLRITLALALSSDGRLREAETLLRQTSASLVSAGNQPILAGTAASNLGLILAASGRFGEAQDAYRVAAAAFDQAGPRGKEGSQIARNNLAVLLLQQGQSAEAEEILAGLLREAPYSDASLLTWQHNRGLALADLFRFEEAEAQLRPILEAARSGARTNQDMSLQMAATATALALIQARRGRTDEAAALYGEAIEARMSAHCPSGTQQWDRRSPQCPGSPQFVDLAWDLAWVSLLRGQQRAGDAYRVLQAGANQSLMRTIPFWPAPDAEAEFLAGQSIHRDAVTAGWAIDDRDLPGLLDRQDVPRADAAASAIDAPGGHS